ncbi:MAG: hypothetical protein ACK4ND_14960 [Cytophagaceae bacterium]
MKNHFFKVATVFCLLILTLFGGCKKEEEEYPYRFNELYVYPNGGKLSVRCGFPSKATNSRKETGVILGSDEDLNLNEYMYKNLVDDELSFINGSLSFTARFEDLGFNKEFYARAYNIDSKDNVAYSEIKKFTTGSIDVDSISPKKGGDDAVILIYGKNFNKYKEYLGVQFRGYESPVHYNQVRYPEVLSDNIIQVEFANNNFNRNQKIDVVVINHKLSDYVHGYKNTVFFYE